MKEIDELIDVVDHLFGPEGCPWDRKQTMKSSRTYVLEEVCELIEAIDLDDNGHIREELGDLFFNAVFLSRLAEKEGRCLMKEAIQEVTEKLIRRHPHVFGEKTEKTTDEVLEQWEEIKKSEKKNSHRKSALDGIPKGLPSLARAYKMIKKMQKNNYTDLPTKIMVSDFDNEESLGELLLQLVASSVEKGIDPEHALRKSMAQLESAFRNHEVNWV